MEFLMVDISSITSNTSRSEFSESDLDIMADIILESGGLIRPITLKKIGFDKYEVMNGYFEYYAAVRAYEKNPRQAESVNALIVNPDREAAAIKQALSLQKLLLPKEQMESVPIPSNVNGDNRLTNIELRFEKQNNDLRSELLQLIKQLEKRMNKLEESIPQKQEPLESLNSLSQAELSIKLRRSRIPGAEKKAQAIVEARKKKKNSKFENYTDVVKSVKGLGEKTMLTIIDDWS